MLPRLSTRLEMVVASDQVERLVQPDWPVKAQPFTGVAAITKIEAISADIIEPGKRRLKLRLERIRAVAAEPDNEAILVAVPLPVQADRIVELGRADRRKKARRQNLGDQLLAGRRDNRLCDRRHLGPGSTADINPAPLDHYDPPEGQTPANFYPTSTRARNPSR
jgi:hypothetical protein